MSILKRMLEGQIPLNVYLAQLKDDINLQTELRRLVPPDARKNPTHPLWDQLAYTAFETADFDLFRVLQKQCRMDGSLGDNLSIFCLIATVYSCLDPSVQLTNQYEDAFELLLDISGERFGGPEVDGLIDELIREVLAACKTKKAQRQMAKEKMNTLFHVTDRRLPQWLHGPEWPMGQNSPMRYVSTTKEKNKSCRMHLFQDVDTGEQRQLVEYD